MSSRIPPPSSGARHSSAAKKSRRRKQKQNNVYEPHGVEHDKSQQQQYEYYNEQQQNNKELTKIYPPPPQQYKNSSNSSQQQNRHMMQQQKQLQKRPPQRIDQRQHSAEYRQTHSSPVEREYTPPPRDESIANNNINNSRSGGGGGRISSSSRGRRREGGHVVVMGEEIKGGQLQHNELSNHYYTPPRRKVSQKSVMQSTNNKSKSVKRKEGGGQTRRSTTSQQETTIQRQGQGWYPSPSSNHPNNNIDEQKQYYNMAPYYNSHYATPPRQNNRKHLNNMPVEHMMTNEERRYQSKVQQNDSSLVQYDVVNPPHLSHVSLSAGVAEMATTMHGERSYYIGGGGDTVSSIGGAGGYNHSMIHEEKDEEGSKKSRQSRGSSKQSKDSSKGILSRASKKIKKRLVGGKSGSKDRRGESHLVVVGDGSMNVNEHPIEREENMNPSDDLASTTWSRERPDPSPAEVDEGRRNSDRNGGWVYSGNDNDIAQTNHPDAPHVQSPQLNHSVSYQQRHQNNNLNTNSSGYQQVLNAFPSLGTSHDSSDVSTHASTLSTTLTPFCGGQHGMNEIVEIISPGSPLQQELPTAGLHNFLGAVPAMPMEEGSNNNQSQQQRGSKYSGHDIKKVASDSKVDVRSQVGHNQGKKDDDEYPMLQKQHSLPQPLHNKQEQFLPDQFQPIHHQPPQSADTQFEQKHQAQKQLEEAYQHQQDLQQEQSMKRISWEEELDNNNSSNKQHVLHDSLMVELVSTLGNKVSTASKPLPVQSEDLHAFSKQSKELKHENCALTLELQSMKQKMIEQEDEMDNKVAKLNQELLKQEYELRDMSEQEQKLKALEVAADKKFSDYVSQLSSDLEAYKGECASYRERILQKERENAKMETQLYEERKKVASLESKNQMLLNIADDNASHTTSSDRAKDTELAAYREQCQKYRQRVLDLERKVMTAESAIEASGLHAASLEENKKCIITQLEEFKSKNASLEASNKDLQSKLEAKEREANSCQEEMSMLKTEWSQAKTDMDDVKAKAEEDRQTVRILESENASLLHQLDEANASLAKLEVTADRCTQVEEENKTLKKSNDDLTSQHLEMSKEVNNAQSLASNTERLQKIMHDNEGYIAKLQDDLSKTRVLHLETLQELRLKHSAEINTLNDKLHSITEMNHDLVTKNNELEGKVSLIENAYSELESSGTYQTKSQSDQILKLMEHADELRKKSMDCQEETASLKQELSEKLHTHDRIVKELQSNVKLLEETKVDLSENLASTNKELLQMKENKVVEVKELERAIQEKDDALAKLQKAFFECSVEKTKCTDSLKSTIQQLEHDLKDATSSRNVLNKRLHELQLHFVDAMNSMRIEKTTLLSDVQSQLLEEREALMHQVKNAVCSYGQRVDSHKLEQSMNHSVAMSTVHSEKRDIEQQLCSEKEITRGLEKSLSQMNTDNQELRTIINDACTKLTVGENGALIDAIDDILLDRSDARMQVKTLEVDITTLTSSNAKLEYENDKLSKQLDEKGNEVKRLKTDLEQGCEVLRAQTEEYKSLEERLEKVKAEAQSVQDQMRKAFDADRRSQDKTVEDIISSKEEALRQQHELEEKVEELTQEIMIRDEKLLEIQDIADMSRQECNDLTSKYEDCREQLAHLIDKAVNSKDKADELTDHYMKIEDDLRNQLQSVHSEREGLEQKLAAVQKESDRQMEELSKTLECRRELVQELEHQLNVMKKNASQDANQLDTLSNEIVNLKQEFGKEKQELASNLRAREETIKDMGKQIDNKKKLIGDMKDSNSQATNQINTLSNELDSMKKCNYELQERYDTIFVERDSLVNKVERLSSVISDLEAFKDNTLEELHIMADGNRLEYAKDMKTLQDDVRCMSAEKEVLAATLQEERRMYSKTVANLQDEIDCMTTREDGEVQDFVSQLEAERLVHDNAVAELQSVFDLELEQERTKSKMYKSEISLLREKASQLQEEIDRLNETRRGQDYQVIQLKESLKDGLEEALRLGSKVSSEQYKLVQPLQQSQSELGGINTTQSSQALEDKSGLQESLKKITAEKQRIEVQLADREAKLFKTMNTLTHFELKLIKVEQDNARLQNDLSSAEKTQLAKEQELINQIVNLKRDTGVDQSNDEMQRDIQSRIEGVEVHNMNLFKEEIKSLTAEKDRLYTINEDILAENMNLVENLASLTSKLRAEKDSDESSTVSGTSSMTSRTSHHLKRTASELETTIRAVKKHHSGIVTKLQSELGDARKRISKYERKVKDLTNLIQENSFVIESLHKKLRGKKKKVRELETAVSDVSD